MFFTGHGVDLVFEHFESPDDAGAGFVGFDDVIDVAAFGGDEGVGEAVAELAGLLDAYRVLIDGGGEFAAVDDIDRAFGAHDGDLRGRPGEVDIGAQVFGAQIGRASCRERETLAV